MKDTKDRNVLDRNVIRVYKHDLVPFIKRVTQDLTKKTCLQTLKVLRNRRGFLGNV